MKDYKKILLGVLLSLFIMGMVIAPLKPVYAFAPDVVAVNTAKWVWDKIEKVYSKVQGIIGAEIVNNTVSMFMNTLAYDISTELATGGTGGKPLFRTKTVRQYLAKAQEAALGEFLGELTDKKFADLGINLCDPSLGVKLTLTLSLIDAEAPPKPKCDWREVQKNWQDFDENLANDLVKLQLDPRSGATSTRAFFQSFTLANSDFGAFQKLQEEASKKKAEEKEAKQISLAECQGFLDKGTTVTGEVKTNCATIMKMSFVEWDAAVAISQNQIAAQKEAATQSLGTIIKNSAKLFYNNFAAKLMKTWIKKGMWSLFGDDDGGLAKVRENLLDQLRGGGDIRQPRGQDIFKDFKQIEITKLDEYNFLEEFIVCPDIKDFRHPDNCVLSPELGQAIISKKTVKEAIDEGVINGNILLVSPDDLVRDGNDDCYIDALCYSNLVKLRKANIIPLGWELAALESFISSPVTLQQAIDCFEDAPGSDCIFNGSPHNPFYHLIDEDWVLKIPPASCDAFVYSPTLESSASSNRQQYCADPKVCLREDDQGNCLDGQFGYCTRSENIWRFQGEICEDGELYSGCLTFSNDEVGNSSYIESTLDFCTSDEVGCKRYSQERDNDGNWVLEDVTLDDNDLFLNKQSPNCSGEHEGCSEFIALSPDLGVNSIPNSDFDLDHNEDNIPDGWSSAGIEYDGEKIANDNNLAAEQEIILLPNTTYILSASASQYTPNLPPGDRDRAFVTIKTCDRTNNCTNTSRAHATEGDCIITNNDAILGFDPYDNFDREQCSFTTNEYVVSARINLSSSDVDGIWFDKVKLEVVSNPNSATSYSAYGQGGEIYIKSSRTMCTAEEVGCQGYTPANGDPMIPAVIGQDDLCPAECVGYATFTEQVNNFDIAEGNSDVEYYNFIPDTARECPAQQVGCEEFTNLDEVNQGGEGKEYYSYLRQCVLEEMGDVYYTWEGSDTTGYQIRTWQILASNLDNGPCTNLSLINYNGYPDGYTCIDGDSGYDPAVCNDPDTNPNCREFFDTSGNTFRRLQDRVIFADDNCSDYRRTATGQIYKALASMSTSCSASNDQCRAYYGNAANNVKIISQDDFEEGNYRPWRADPGHPMPLDLSNESLNNDGHSLKFTTYQTNDRIIIRPELDNEIEGNKEYTISWWMKNDSHLDTIQAFIYGTWEGFFRPIPLNDVNETGFNNIAGGGWHYYTASRFVSEADIAGLDGFGISFQIQGLTDEVFLDNIIFRKVVDSITVIKNSWQTPVSCDDPYAGYYLGCQSYIDTNRIQFNLKSFNRLCREEVIGCTPVIDTHNSTYPFEETFHLGDNSEITVLADKLDYLVPDSSKYCLKDFKGCLALGLPDREIEDAFNTVYKINNPDKYGLALCYYDGLNCEDYDSDKGLYYFKDPETQTCTYQENIKINDVLWSGWWKTNTLDSDEPMGCSDTKGSFTPGDLELADGWAAMCPNNKNLCTGFRDPTDPEGCDPSINDPNSEDYCHTYYYYNNDKIDEKSCLGQVDPNSGCALFYETNNWNAEHSEVVTPYDSGQTYNAAVAANRPVSPISCDPEFDPNCHADSNKLIKVKKDRQCAEWLACRSSSAVWDSNQNEYKTICDSLGSCLEYSSTNNITNCQKWDISSDDIVALTKDVYQSRATGHNEHLKWSDNEYTGYSIPDLLPTEDLVIYNFGTEDDQIPRLVFNACRAVPCLLDNNGNEYFSSCLDNDGDPCSTQIGGDPFNGECKDNLCFLSPQVDSPADDFDLETRGFAMPEAPFPSAVAPGGTDKLQAYSGANVCQEGNNSCEISYKRITYGRGNDVRYHTEEYTSALTGLCTSGDYEYEGSECKTNADCGEDGAGICLQKTKEETFQNWPGVCLEYDATEPLAMDNKQSFYCNQWYPANSISGTDSMYDNYREAGYYNPDGSDALFCAVAEPYQLPEDRVYCVSAINLGGGVNGCVVLARVPRDSNIRLDALEGWSDFIINSYLSDSSFAQHPADYDPDGNGSFGVEWVERRGVTNETPRGTDCQRAPLSDGFANGFDSFFIASDFNNDQVDTISIEDLESIFYNNVDLIEYYYYDQQVSPDGSTQADHGVPTGILTPERSMPLQHYNNQYTCKGENCSGVGNCLPGYHEAQFKGVHQGKHCGTGGPRRRYIWKGCNPLEYNYYIKAENPNAEPLCSSFNCMEPNKGRACLQTAGSWYDRILNFDTDFDGNSWPWLGRVADMTSENNCGNDPGGVNNNCRFIYCIEHLSIVPQLRTDQNGNNISSVLCEEYGSIQFDGDVAQNIYSCLDRIFELQGPPPPFGYQSKNGIYTELLDEIYDPGPNPNGCLESDQPINCHISQGVEECHLVYTPPFNWDFVCDSYNVETEGTLCEGFGANACYQQCDTLTQLDSEGDNSWVKTDIWWRNETTNPGRINNWVSYYYSVPNYIQNSNVQYSNINGENIDDFTHFGSAMGIPGDLVVTSRVPLAGSYFEGLSAATFFGDDWAAESRDQIAYLFARAYNLNWNIFGPNYVQGDVDLIYSVHPNSNTEAGNDHDPRILRVCEDDVCNGGEVGFTINNQTEGDIIGHQSLFTAVKFFYFAHPDHMPVMDIRVNWGDDINISNPGKYKNRLPNCDPDAHMPYPGAGLQGFGGIDRACQEGYKIFYHDYQYDPGHPCNGGGGSPHIAHASCYQVSVGATDHWGLATDEVYNDWVIIYEE